jgi:hypothetical protein
MKGEGGPRQVERTGCKDGIVISTISLETVARILLGLGLPALPYPFETAVLTRTGECEVVRKYQTLEEAIAGHAALVRDHGGRAFLG